MWRLSGRLQLRILTFAFLMAMAPLEAEAQAVREINRVVSVTPDNTQTSVLLNTSLNHPIAAPTIQYLPGDHGETIMVADFHGLVWGKPPEFVSPRTPGLKEVRIGQFQTNPPVLRIAITASDPRLLRHVAFRAAGSSLTVRWPDENFKAHAYVKPPVEQEPPRKRLYPWSGREAHSDSQAEPVVNTSPANALAQSDRAIESPAPVRTSAPVPEVSIAKEEPLPAKRQEPAKKADPAAEQLARARKSLADARKRLAEARQRLAQARKETQLAEEAEAKMADGTRNETSANADLSPAPREEPKARATVASNNQSRKSEIAPAPERLPEASPGKSKPEASAKAPPVAPEIVPARVARQMPPAAPPASSFANVRSYHPAGMQSALDALSVKPPDKARADAQYPPEVAPSYPGAKPVPANQSELEVPRVALTQGAAIKIDVIGTNAWSFKTFRLTDPERFVVDLAGASPLSEKPPLEVADNPYLKAVRFGKPEGDDTTTRVVLDLAGTSVSIRQTLSESGDTLSLSVGPELMTEDIKAPAGMTVVIDAGHGGSDPGAQRGDIQEKELTLNIAAKIRQRLEKSGVKVVMTRSDDSFVSLEDRVKLTNSEQPNAFVSVHINSLETNSNIHGVETYYQTEQSKDLARSVHDALVSKLVAPDRFVRKARFYVINHTPVPAVLAEVGFISNGDEREKLVSADYQNGVAEAVSQGVILYLSKRPDLAQTSAPQAKAATARDSAQSPKANASLAQAGTGTRPAKQ